MNSNSKLTVKVETPLGRRVDRWLCQNARRYESILADYLFRYDPFQFCR